MSSGAERTSFLYIHTKPASIRLCAEFLGFVVFSVVLLVIILIIFNRRYFERLGARCWWHSWYRHCATKPDGRGFDSRWCHWNFFIDISSGVERASFLYIHTKPASIRLCADFLGFVVFSVVLPVIILIIFNPYPANVENMVSS